MAKRQNGYVAAIDSLPWIVRVLLCLPGIDGIIFGIYRIFRGHVIAGIIWIFVGAAILWIVDIICMIAFRKVLLFA